MSNYQSTDSLCSVDDKTEEFSKAIILERQRNCHIPISRLPTEILSVIFFYTIIDDESEYNLRSGWISITYVCNIWREIALNSPSLWSYWGIPNSRWIETFISRSGQVPLYIRFRPQMDMSIKSFVKLLRRPNCRDRVRVLHITGFTSFPTKVVDAFDHCQASDDLASKVPSECPIRSLFIDSSSELRGCRLPKTFQSLRFPHLSRLELFYCAFDWSSTFFKSAVLVHLTVSLNRDFDEPTSSCLLSALANQPLLEELILANYHVDHTNDIDIAVNLPHLQLIKLRGHPSSCFTLLTRLSYPRTKISIEFWASSCDEHGFTLDIVPFLSKHYGNYGSCDVPRIKNFSIKNHHSFHVLCAPCLKSPNLPSDHEISHSLTIAGPWQFGMIVPMMRSACAVLPLCDVRSFVYEGMTLSYDTWKSSMFEAMTSLEEMKLSGDNVREAIFAMNLARVGKRAACDEDVDHRSRINHGDVNELNSVVPSDTDKSTEEDEVTSPIPFPKLKTLRIIYADFSHLFLSGFVSWLKSRKHASCELDLLSLEYCSYIDLNKVEGYRKHVKEVIWDTYDFSTGDEDDSSDSES